MIFPRLLAVAERAWHKSEWENQRNKGLRNRLKEKNWEMFANTLGYKELRRLDSIGIHYRIPLPGARYYFFLFFFAVFQVNSICSKGES